MSKLPVLTTRHRALYAWKFANVWHNKYIRAFLIFCERVRILLFKIKQTEYREIGSLGLAKNNHPTMTTKDWDHMDDSVIQQSILGGKLSDPYVSKRLSKRLRLMNAREV